MKINTILFAIICISVLCITYTNASSQQLLKPIKQGTKQVGIVFVQGAQIAPEAYLPLAKKIQKESALSIYIVIPAFPPNTIIFMITCLPSQHRLIKFNINFHTPS